MKRAGAPPRVQIQNVRPTVPGDLAAKAAVGQSLPVTCDLVCDGHDLLLGAVRHGIAAAIPPAEWRPSASPLVPGQWAQMADPMDVPLLPLGDDRWHARITPTVNGPWVFEILALPDRWGSWLRDLAIRREAGHDLTLEFEVGARIAEDRRRGASRTDVRSLEALADALRDVAMPDTARIDAAAHPDVQTLMRRVAPWDRAARSGPHPLFVDRERAVFSSWYEMFPRSVGADPPRGGTLATAATRLPEIAAMGFDTVYLPPIHPIGRSHRKGPNNALEAGPDDVGSPWAIGDQRGGHTAVHPDLGTIGDFDAFVAAAAESRLEVALDLAIQCSPDHPWVAEHPNWFAHRPDGSIRYAENPPKRYQDIYPIDFETEDWEALWRELRDVVLFWHGHGVRMFRVDNPHTKAFPFWRWLIADVQARDPGVLFLAEAFTRPRIMERLAQIGFTQSYTYFTWRTGRDELAEYLTELSQTDRVDWMRPNFWPNTPDILHEFLQHGGNAAFRLRAVLAALCCPSWGIYSGYELCEATPVGTESEEYLDSEKYQLRPRNYAQPGSIAPWLTTLNGIRARHRAAIAQLRTLRVHPVDGSDLLAVSRIDEAGADVLLVVVNVDPHSPREGTTCLDLAALGIPDTQSFEAHDELTNTPYIWQGARNYVRLDPAEQPAHALHLRPRG